MVESEKREKKERASKGGKGHSAMAVIREDARVAILGCLCLYSAALH